MNPNLTEIVFILDRSGSMSSMCLEAIGGFNGFVSDQRKEPGEAKLSLVLFDHDYTLIHDGVRLADVPELNTQTYVPRGTTALYDAVGRAIDDVGQRLAKVGEDERPRKVIVAILTDGMENASKDYSLARVSEMIKHQTEKYGWSFIFLGANIDAVAVSKDLNIPVNNTVQFTANAVGYQGAYTAMSRTVSTLRSNR